MDRIEKGVVYGLCSLTLVMVRRTYLICVYMYICLLIEYDTKMQSLLVAKLVILSFHQNYFNMQMINSNSVIINFKIYVEFLKTIHFVPHTIK